jgi:hypothetical protein
MVIVWREREHEEIDNQGVDDLKEMNALCQLWIIEIIHVGKYEGSKASDANVSRILEPRKLCFYVGWPTS